MLREDANKDRGGKCEKQVNDVNVDVDANGVLGEAAFDSSFNAGRQTT